MIYSLPFRLALYESSVLRFPITWHIFGNKILLDYHSPTSRFTSSNIYAALLSTCHDYLLTASPMCVNKNTHAASEGAYVSSELLMAVYNRAQRDNYGLINNCSDRW